MLIAKGERRFTGFDDKIIAMYARGMSVREIQGFLLEMYGIEVSPDFISTVTDAVIDEVLVNNEVRVGRVQNVADVPSLQQPPGEFADRRVVSRRRGEPQDIWVVTAATRKARNQPNGPAVDGAQSICTVRHTGTVQPATKCRHASIRVREHEDGFAISVSGQGVGDQLCLAAPRRCSDSAACNCAQVDFNGAHGQPTQVSGANGCRSAK